MTEDDERQIEPIGYFRLETFLDENQQVTAEIELYGMSREEAIGRLGAVVDRYKEIIASQWDDWDELEIVPAECPHCGGDVFDHEHDGEDTDHE